MRFSRSLLYVAMSRATNRVGIVVPRANHPPSRLCCLKGEETLAEAGHEVLHIAAVRVPVEAGKASPAERQAQVFEERKTVPLVCEQRVGAAKWHLDAVWPAAADVGFCVVVRRQIDRKRMQQVRFVPCFLLDPLVEQIGDEAWRMDAERIVLFRWQIEPKSRLRDRGVVVPSPVDPADNAPECEQCRRNWSPRYLLDAGDNRLVVRFWRRPEIVIRRRQCQPSGRP